MTDLTSLDRDVAAARVVDEIRRVTALRLAHRAARKRLRARRGGPARAAALWAVAGLAAALAALARRMER